jgi:hypothetical protein
MNILKLAKNLKKFTSDEICMLAECDCRGELENLMAQNLLQFDGQVYKYCEKIIFPFELVQKTEIKTGERILFKTAAQEYLRAKILTESTLKGYNYQLKFNILPYFGDKFLDEITLTMLNDFMSFLKSRYKPKTVWNGITLTGSILKWAFEEGLIGYNPYLGVKNTMPKRKGTLSD